MKRKFIYITADPDGTIRNVFYLYLGKSVHEAKQAQELYRRADALGHYFSLMCPDAQLLLDNILVHTSVQPQLVTYVSLLKYFVI